MSGTAHKEKAQSSLRYENTLASLSLRGHADLLADLTTIHRPLCMTNLEFVQLFVC